LFNSNKKGNPNMGNLRRQLLHVALVATLCGIGQAAKADETTLAMDPPTVPKGSTQLVRIKWPTTLPAGNPGLSKAKTVTIAGQEAKPEGAPTAAYIIVNLPALQITGSADVSVSDGTGVLGVGHLLYVAPSDATAKSDVVWHPRVLAVYALLLVLFPFALMWTDILQAYTFAGATRNQLMAKFSADKLSMDELKELIAEFDKSPPGIPGLARATLALTLLLLLGLIIFYFLAVAGHDIPSGIDKFLTALTTAFASVVAFYFGTKAAQGSAAGSTSAKPGTPGGASQSSAAVTPNPNHGAAGAPIVFQGTGFGSDTGAVTFGTTPATPDSWTDTAVTAKVPAGLAGQKVTITVTAKNGAVFNSAANAFTVD
jgi:IPT/TIG domain